MPPPSASFQFIDQSFIDKRARRSIRSHVMKGKNVGKVRAPRRQPTTMGTIDANALALQPEITFSQAKYSPQLLIQLGDELSGVKTACSISTHSRRFLHDFMCYAADSIYPSQFCLEPYAMVKTTWLRYMFVDEGYFHCLVALAEGCINFLTQRERYSNDFNHHMAKGLQLINTKLSGIHAVSDIAIGTVILLCLLSSIRELPSQTKVHFDGLCRMIALRGGLDQLQGNPVLTEKSQRLDIELALQLGCSTQLRSSAKTLQDIIPAFNEIEFESSPFLVNAVIHGSPQVLGAVQDIARVTCRLNSTVADRRLFPLSFQDIVTTLSYQLLDIEPVDGCLLIDAVTKAVHRCLLAFLITFVTQIGRQRRISYPLLERSLTEALGHPEFLARIDPATHVWLLIVTGISVLNPNKFRLWLKPRLEQALSTFGTTNWQFGCKLLASYPWVGSLHDERASQVWHICLGPGSHAQY